MAGFIIDGGEIPLRYFDKSSYDYTYRISGYGLSFKDVYEALSSVINEDEITDMCKVDANVFNFTVSTTQAAGILDTLGLIRIKDRTFEIVSINKQTVEFRVHWLPTYIRDSFLEDFFSKYGTVKQVIREAVVFGPNSTKRSGVRRIVMETDENRRRALPYVITFRGGYTALITIPGRPPLCLKCKSIGHLRKDCPPSTPKTYAAATSTSKETSTTTATTTTPTDKTTDTNSTAATTKTTTTTTDVYNIQDSFNSTGSTIPPNGPKRGCSDESEDDDDLMIDDDDAKGEWLPAGKKAKVNK